MKLVTKTLAGLALAASFAAPAIAGVCSSQTTLTGLGPPGASTFGQSFNSNGTRGDCYTFNLSAPSNGAGTTTLFDFSIFGNISLSNVSLFGGGVLAGATQGAALISDNSPSAFAFTTAASGPFTLQVTSTTSGCLPFIQCALPVGYNGTLVTTAAVPEPASLALLGLGLLGLGFARRKTNC